MCVYVHIELGVTLWSQFSFPLHVGSGGQGQIARNWIDDHFLKQNKMSTILFFFFKIFILVFFSPQIQQFSKKEIEDLLRKGAYAAIMEEDDEGSKFCEEDIDQILLRRTTTITIESEGKGSTFAKVCGRSSMGRQRWRQQSPGFKDF